MQNKAWHFPTFKTVSYLIQYYNSLLILIKCHDIVSKPFEKVKAEINLQEKLTGEG